MPSPVTASTSGGSAAEEAVIDIAEATAVEIIGAAAIHLMSAAAVKCGLAPDEDGVRGEDLKDLAEARRPSRPWPGS